MRDPDWCPIAEGIPGRVKGWHGKMWTFEASFGDGHASDIVMNGYRAERLSSYPAAGCCTADDTPDDCHDCYQCVIVRGPNWQKDTLPSASVVTGFIAPDSGRPSQEAGDVESGD
jgi:hypothetical protein